MPCTTTTLYKMHRASSPPLPRRQHSIHCRWTSTTNTVYSTLWPTQKKAKTPTISHLPPSLISLSCFLSCSRILFPPLCCRLMIHFFQMREALVVIGSVRGCILLVGNLRQKRNIKKRRKLKHILGDFFCFGIYDHAENFFGIYFRNMRTAKQGQEKDSNC